MTGTSFSPDIMFMVGFAAGLIGSGVAFYVLTSQAAGSWRSSPGPRPAPVARVGSNSMPALDRPTPPQAPMPRIVSDSPRSNISTFLARQQLTIAKLKERCAQHEADKEAIHNILYCIGGPLNDNKLAFSKQQMVPLFRIAQLAENGYGRKIEVDDA